MHGKVSTTDKMHYSLPFGFKCFNLHNVHFKIESKLTLLLLFNFLFFFYQVYIPFVSIFQNLYSAGAPSSGNAYQEHIWETYFVSSATSTSAGAVMGALECPAVGSSVFSSPFVELMTWGSHRQKQYKHFIQSPEPKHFLYIFCVKLESLESYVSYYSKVLKTVN